MNNTWWMKRKQYRRIAQARWVVAAGSDPLGGWVWLAAPIAPVRRVALAFELTACSVHGESSMPAMSIERRITMLWTEKISEKPIRSHDGFMHRISGTHSLVLNHLMRCLSSNS